MIAGVGGGFALDGLVSYYLLVVRTGWRTPAQVPGSFKGARASGCSSPSRPS